MKKFIGCMLCLLAGLLIIGPVGTYAQTTTAQVSGQVTDVTAAAVPQASVTITNVDTALTRKIETSATGYYVITLLPPGKYKLTAEKQGFQKAEYPGLILEVNQNLNLNVVLSVGAVTQSVTVNAQAQQLQTASSNLGAVITARAVSDLPLNGRNFTQLLILTPGVTPVSTAQSARIGGPGALQMPGIPGSTFAEPSVGGAWNRSNFYLMDGVNDTTWFGSNYTVLPVLDSIQEFKVQSHNDDPEYGGVLGGIVNVVTKSGTNSLHGSAWEFVRNDVFDARDPFADAHRSSPAPFRQNEFGFSVGGPIVVPRVYKGQNRSWFFFTYEGWRYRKPSDVLSRVPTAAELSGDFSADFTTQVLFDPATTRSDPNNPGAFIRDPFVCNSAGGPVVQGTAGAAPCNKIPTDRLDPMAVGYNKLIYDAPNYAGSQAYNYLATAGARNDDDTYIFRFDQRISDKDTAWFRYARMANPISSPQNSKVTTLANRDPWNWGAGETHLFSPTLIFDGRVGSNLFTSPNGTGPNAGNAPFQQLGFQGTDQFGYVNLGLSSPYSYLNIGGPGSSRETTWDFSGTLTWVHGRHTIKAGFQFFRPRFRCCAWEPGTGARNQYLFSDVETGDPANVGTTGDSLASELLGLPGTVYFAAQRYDYNFKSWAPFIEDNVQLTPKLSLTLGLRYDYMGSPQLTSGIASELDPATGNWIISGTALPPACNTSLAAPCLPGNGLIDVPYGNKIKLASNSNLGPNAVSGNIGPRIGLAWLLSKKTVARAGYGIVYDSLAGLVQAYQANVGSWPDASNAQITANTIGAPLTNLMALQSVSASPLPTASPWNNLGWMFDPNIKNGRSQQWNVGIQHQLMKDTVLSIGYVGSHSDRLNVSGVFNVSPVAGPGTPAEVNARRPFPWAHYAYMAEAAGRAHYNSLQVSAQKRYSAGMQFLISYTLSRAADVGGSGYFGAENGPGGGSVVQNFYDMSKDWGPSSFDVTHYFTAAMQYELPAGKGKRFLNNGPLSWVLGNWQTNTVTMLRSGQPFNLGVQGDVANIGVPGGGYARPNLVGNPSIANPSASEWYNTAAFAIPVLSFGNFGKNALRSAPVYTADFSLFKNFSIKEHVDLEFRAEAFNIFNIQSLGVPGTTIGVPSAGVISSVVLAPRQLQLGMHLSF